MLFFLSRDCILLNGMYHFHNLTITILTEKSKTFENAKACQIETNSAENDFVIVYRLVLNKLWVMQEFAEVQK